MLEVSIFDRPFVNACRAIADGLCLYDNSLYYFANGLAIGFKEKRPGTVQTDQGYWQLSGLRAKGAKEVRAELDHVNTQYTLVNYVRNNFDHYVESVMLSGDTGDIWQRVRILVVSDRVFVQFPEVRGRIIMRDKTVRLKTTVPPMPITVMPELIEKLLGICEAAELPLDFDPVEVIANAYRGTCGGAHVAAHGYAMVLLLQNKIEGM
jgi:hypothetical protein